MESSLRFTPSPLPPKSTQTLTLNRPPISPPPRRRPPPAIRAAISRAKKEQTVDSVKTQLENCHLLAGIRYKGFTVTHFQELRRTLPETAHLLVAKNTLVGKAIEGTPWAALAPCMTGMNAWIFVHGEEIPAALKPYRTFQRERKLEDNDFVGGVFEGRFYPPEEFGVLETLPGRAEIYGSLLGSLQAPAIGIVGTLRAPATEIVALLKAYVRKLEEEGGGEIATATATAAAPNA